MAQVLTKYDVADLGGFAAVFPELADERVAQKKFFAYIHGGHIFRPGWITGARARDIWTKVLTTTIEDWAADVDDTMTETESAELALNTDEFIKAWKEARSKFIVSYYEAYALSHKVECERDMIHALFTCLAFLAKGQNKTSNWITSRFKRVQESMAGVTDLDSAVIQEFDKRYSGCKLTNEQIFRALAASYMCLDETPAHSLCWVLEHAMASNITAALAVAEVVLKTTFLPLQSPLCHLP